MVELVRSGVKKNWDGVRGFHCFTNFHKISLILDSGSLSEFRLLCLQLEKYPLQFLSQGSAKLKLALPILYLEKHKFHQELQGSNIRLVHK